MTDEDTMP